MVIRGKRVGGSNIFQKLLFQFNDFGPEALNGLFVVLQQYLVRLDPLLQRVDVTVLSRSGILLRSLFLWRQLIR